jgi:hypothetical protein
MCRPPIIIKPTTGVLSDVKVGNYYSSLAPNNQDKRAAQTISSIYVANFYNMVPDTMILCWLSPAKVLVSLIMSLNWCCQNPFGWVPQIRCLLTLIWLRQCAAKTESRGIESRAILPRYRDPTIGVSFGAWGYRTSRSVKRHGSQKQGSPPVAGDATRPSELPQENQDVLKKLRQSVTPPWYHRQVTVVQDKRCDDVFDQPQVKLSKIRW